MGDEPEGEPAMGPAPEPPVEEPPVHHYQHQNQLMMALKLM
jgi:hypothetical protein